MELKIVAGGVAQKKHGNHHSQSGSSRAQKRDTPGKFRAVSRDPLLGDVYRRCLNEPSLSAATVVKDHASENTELRSPCPTMPRLTREILLEQNKFEQKSRI
jgi:hypothetical protein